MHELADVESELNSGQAVLGINSRSRVALGLVCVPVSSLAADMSSGPSLSASGSYLSGPLQRSVITLADRSKMPYCLNNS